MNFFSASNGEFVIYLDRMQSKHWIQGRTSVKNSKLIRRTVFGVGELCQLAGVVCAVEGGIHLETQLK